MKRTAICLFVCIAIGGWATAVSAAGRKKKASAAASQPAPADTTDQSSTGPAPAADDATPPAASDSATPPPAAGDTATGNDVDTSVKPEALENEDNGLGETAAAPVAKVDASADWKNIVVLPRKRFLKGGRFELAPFTGMSINDILIRHYAFGLDLNFYLTDVLWLGLEGQYFIKDLTDREALVGLQYNRIPTLNQYLYGGALNFGYVPLYGKFAFFNSGIAHWEMFASAGVGVTRTQIIPRDPGNAAFTNLALTPNFAVGGRLFLFDWLTVNWTVRDYLLLDKFENPNRPLGQSAALAKADADNELVHNVMFLVGVGFYLPTKFQYKLPR